MSLIGRYVAVAIGLGSLLMAGCGDEAGLPAENVTPPNATSPSETASAPQPSDPAPVTDPTLEMTPVETPWTPPSITSPTIPYTLPPDYGEAPTITRDIKAPPRSTYLPNAILPPVEWIVDDTVTVRFTPPSNFSQDPRPLNAIQDYDRANGLYVLERWWVPDEAAMATFSVQANPGDESPLLTRQEFPDSITTGDLTWYLWNNETVEQTGKPSNMGLAVTNDYVYMVSGTRASMQALVEGLTIER